MPPVSTPQRQKMSGRLRVTPAVFVAAVDGSKVVLQRRKGTGWMDGHYDLPSGHIEPGESLKEAAARELEEESGLKASLGDLELFHIAQNDAGSNGPYVYFVFRTKHWTGHISDDDDKVDSIGFFNMNALPKKLVPYVRRALKDIRTKTLSYSYFDKDYNERKIHRD